MNLYILRHASAGTSRPNPVIDAKRPLDKEGKQHCLQLAHILNTLKVSFDLIASSPLKRALQTAQLVATETGYEAPITQTDALLPSATLSDFQRLLHETHDRENVLVVGHNPNLQLFLGSLLVPARAAEAQEAGLPPANSQGQRQTAAQVRLRKGSLARLSIVRGPATLLSLMEPRTVRALYATSTKSSRLKTSRK